MPDELPAFDDPAATKYGTAQLYQFLAHYHLPRDIGAEWDYSNIGYWILGQALASRTGTDYESLFRTRVIAPLKLKSTAIILSPKLKAKLAVGHNAVLQPSPSMSTVPGYASMLDVLSLVSTANDLLTFLSVAMGYESSPLAPAMASMLNTRRPMPQPGSEQALGWVVIGESDNQLAARSGLPVLWLGIQRDGLALSCSRTNWEASATSRVTCCGRMSR